MMTGTVTTTGHGLLTVDSINKVQSPAKTISSVNTLQNSQYVQGKSYIVQVGGVGYGNNVIGAQGVFNQSYSIVIP
ncbi:hypothetical protein O6R05_08180 [Peptoniphilus equinus]|uniref:Uncharacterized protein n=1 Tax=Peptoniphilus equinus TaxID=3016343 RepID=A0ABY7QT54_9FIRM|nr:hypothetical protein [Peptoniphilus equinus]WBW49969.1 hypothetical protein O6R05_08180 [Peptoniphilus equinus]